MSSTETGRRAEKAAKVYLEMRGFQIIEQNWRRPAAEIDIIARKNDVIHFVEVRYRRNDDQGGGLETVTTTKLRHMRRGAEIWVEEERYRGEFTLSVIEVAAPDYTVTNFIEDVL